MMPLSFLSRTGSYSGSSLQYWAQYDFFDASTDGERVEGTLCDERIRAPSRGGGRKSFRSPRNSLVFKKNNGDDGAIECRYDVSATDQGQTYVTYVTFRTPSPFVTVSLTQLINTVVCCAPVIHNVI